MRKNGLGSTFKDRFDGHVESIDADDMIARLNLDKEENKKRPFVFWLFGVVSRLLFIAAAVYIVSDIDMGSKNVVTRQQEISSGSEYVVENNEFENEKNNDIVSIESGEGQSKSIANETIVINNVIQNKAKNESQFSNVSTPIGNSLKNGNYFLETGGLATVSDEKSNNQIKEKNVISNNTMIDRFIFSSESIVLEESVKLESSINVTTNSTIDLVFPSINSIRMTLYNDNILEADFDPIIIKSTNCNSDEYRMNKQPILLEAYASVYSTNRELVSTSDIYNDHVAMRNSSEKQLESIQVGLAVSKFIGSRFYISAGLEYTHINEVATINYMNDTILVDDNYPVLLQYKANGDTITSFGSANVNSKVKHTLIEYNSQRLFSIPMNAGIQANVGNFSLFAEAGISLNVYQSFYGKMVDVDLAIVSSPSYFTPKLGIGYRTKFGLIYPLSQSLHLSVSANLQRTHSISDIDFVTQKYIMKGIGLGLKYQL